MSKKSFFDLYEYNKYYFFPLLFYISGLLIGSLVFSKISVNKLVEEVLTLQGETFVSIFISQLCVYFSVFIITVLLGLNVIGFPFINIIPFLIGLEIAIKLSFYYVTYKTKGIGYSLLLIIPATSVFFTTLVFSLQCGNLLSQYIFNSSIKKSDTTDEKLSLYLKSFVIYGIVIILISFISSVIKYLFIPLISL